MTGNLKNYIIIQNVLLILLFADGCNLWEWGQKESREFRNNLPIDNHSQDYFFARLQLLAGSVAKVIKHQPLYIVPRVRILIASWMFVFVAVL